jgi:hypothetical protein
MVEKSAKNNGASNKNRIGAVNNKQHLLPYSSGYWLFIRLELVEKEKDFIEDGGQTKIQLVVYHQGPRPIPIIFHNPTTLLVTHYL